MAAALGWRSSAGRPAATALTPVKGTNPEWAAARKLDEGGRLGQRTLMEHGSFNSRYRAGVESGPPQQLRQLGNIQGYAPGLVSRHQSRRRSPARLILEIDVSERVPVGVADDEAALAVFWCQLR